MGVPLLAVSTNHTAVVELVLTEIALWVVIAVDVDLGQGIVSGRFFNSFMDTRLKQRQKKLQPGEREDVTRVSNLLCAAIHYCVQLSPNTHALYEHTYIYIHINNGCFSHGSSRMRLDFFFHPMILPNL